tara:strand:+ start:414 stop:1406 length:993 start_codon:yes stop_codon:yes gene_type:complete
MIKYSVLVTGGAGYVGAELIPKLLSSGYRVSVIDLMIYNKDVFKHHEQNEDLKIFKGDIRDLDLLEHVMKNIDCVIHLACISNDPSFELNPNLGKSINLDCFFPLVKIAKKHGCQRFIYASSSSVYGIKSERNVTEDLSLEPLTDYSKYKAQCEDILLGEMSSKFTTTILRPSTVCGFSRRQRLDVVVNILTSHAYHNKKITILGGEQLRPNIHIKDMVRVYENIVSSESSKIDGKIYNVGYENYSLNEIAKIVSEKFDEQISINYKQTNDPRSYHVSSKLIEKELGFKSEFTVQNAVEDLLNSFKNNLIPNAMTDNIYYNVKRMQEIKL